MTIEYLYGLNPVFEAIRAGRRKISRAYINNNLKNNKRIEKLMTLCNHHNITIEKIEKGKLIQLCNAKENQGVALACSHYPYQPVEKLFESSKLLLIDNVEDPHNVGAILRSAEIFGFKNILLPKKGVPEIYPSVVKVSAGATEFLNITKERSANNYINNAKQKGYSIIVLDAKGNIEIEKLPAESLKKFILVIGGENKSVGQYIINSADHVAEIKQHGKINSLNASVAAGVAMFALAAKS